MVSVILHHCAFVEYYFPYSLTLPLDMAFYDTLPFSIPLTPQTDDFQMQINSLNKLPLLLESHNINARDK